MWNELSGKQSELESAVTEMCEDIRDKDEAVDKAAKIIEMLRTDVIIPRFQLFRGGWAMNLRCEIEWVSYN